MLSSIIKEKALTLGYHSCGIIPAGDFPEYSKSLDERIESFPESRALYEPLYNMATPPKEAKSVIVCIQRYNNYKVPESLDGLIGKFYLFDSRLSYTEEFRVKNEFETFLKTLGLNILQCNLPDRLAAARAGLGKFARNNFIFSPEYGSYIWINKWVVDRELEYEAVPETMFMSECSENCQKCVKSCPTGALTNSLVMNRSKCITQLNCFAKDIPDIQTREEMGKWLYGCDVCQDVCPLNKDKFKEQDEFPLLKEFEEYMMPEKLLEMDEDVFLKIINPRFWYIDKESLWLWKCNSLRYMINTGEKKYYDLIKKYCEHPDKRIREIAQWGRAKLPLPIG